MTNKLEIYFSDNDGNKFLVSDEFFTILENNTNSKIVEKNR